MFNVQFSIILCTFAPLFPKAQRNISCDGELSSSINNLILE
jgi:hypothetical protein